MNRPQYQKDRIITELTGLAHGILADGYVCEAEAEYLLNWIQERPAAMESWPGNMIFKRVQEMMEDGKLDDDEQKELIDTLLHLTGFNEQADQSDTNTKPTTEILTLPLCSPAPKIHFEGQRFVLTGEFAHGSRSECKELLMQLGATVTGSVSGLTNCLIVGSINSPDWAHAAYGRKIEKAVEMRDQQQTGIKIISEEHWLATINQ